MRGSGLISSFRAGLPLITPRSCASRAYCRAVRPRVPSPHPVNRTSPPLHDDFQIFAGNDHRRVTGLIEAPDQFDDVLRQRFPADGIEGFERLEHRAIILAENVEEVLR